ncbi:hypothetical protein FOZ62_015809, partial [Perkinsus olseni]
MYEFSIYQVCAAGAGTSIYKAVIDIKLLEFYSVSQQVCFDIFWHEASGVGPPLRVTEIVGVIILPLTLICCKTYNSSAEIDVQTILYEEGSAEDEVVLRLTCVDNHKSTPATRTYPYVSGQGDLK